MVFRARIEDIYREINENLHSYRYTHTHKMRAVSSRNVWELGVPKTRAGETINKKKSVCALWSGERRGGVRKTPRLANSNNFAAPNIENRCFSTYVQHNYYVISMCKCINKNSIIFPSTVSKIPLPSSKTPEHSTDYFYRINRIYIISH